MKYAQARTAIKTGDIIATSHREGWFHSWHSFKINFVRLWQKSEYSHVAVAWVVAGRVMVLESVTGGIRPFPLSRMLPCYHIACDEPFDVEKAMSVCGEPYSELEAALGALGKTDDTNGRWQCSEYVRWVKNWLCQATPSAIVDHALMLGGALTRIESDA